MFIFKCRRTKSTFKPFGVFSMASFMYTTVISSFETFVTECTGKCWLRIKLIRRKKAQISRESRNWYISKDLTCVSKCSFKLRFDLNAFGQCGHCSGRSSMWDFRCLFKADEYTNVFPHKSHNRFASLCWKWNGI